MVYIYFGICDKIYCVLIIKLNVFVDVELDLVGEGIGIWKFEFVIGVFVGIFVFFGDLVYLQN